MVTTLIHLQQKKTEEEKIKVGFVFPQKKPSIYRSATKEVKKSSILKQKDFEQAKKTIEFIKQKKWNSALKSAAKVKDQEFRTLITWMHLKTTRNGASFNEYKKFIEQKDTTAPPKKPIKPIKTTKPETGGGDGGFTPTTTAQNVARTESRVDSSGNVKAYGLAKGGLARMLGE